MFVTTVYRTWRDLLTESFRREESGVRFGAFLASSDEARHIVAGLLDDSMDLARFVEEMAGVGVQLRMKPEQAGPAVEVLSLARFRD